jgi:preprotein translocase subunit SecA
MLKGDPSKKTKERLQPIVDKVNALEPGMQSKSDEELRAVASELRERVQGGAALEDVQPEAFAVRFRAGFPPTIM